MLKERFEELCFIYSDNESLINELWDKIALNYSSGSRHYHTLQHLENLMLLLSEYKTHINNWDAHQFSVYYHDLIYDASSTDNEEKSAEMAIVDMDKLGVPIPIPITLQTPIFLF